jgi:vanillate monooxygenase ferredoxin subunit
MSLQVTVKSIASEAIDIKSYELVAADGARLPGFTAGAHIDVQLGPTLIRQYSLCNDPREGRRFVIAVRKEPRSRGGSRGMHELKSGDILTISEPRNHFPLIYGTNHSRLIAGGIGITPILAMARSLIATGASFDLHYFARSSAHAAFREPLSMEPLANKTHFHYLQEPTEVEGRLRTLLSADPEGAHLYLCGPTPFMGLVQEVARPQWPADTIHLEYFTGENETVGRRHESFQVKLARSGAAYEVPANRSIVDVLGEHGIFVETSCEQGVCGTCLTTVLAGIPDHRDVYLTDEEKQACDRMTLCVSRAKGPLLVLDL